MKTFFLVLMLLIEGIAFADDPIIPDPGPPPPPPTCDFTLTMDMCGKGCEVHTSCGNVPAPCTCKMTLAPDLANVIAVSAITNGPIAVKIVPNSNVVIVPGGSN